MQAFWILMVFALLAVSWAAKDDNVQEMEQEQATVDEAKLEYAKGSVCGYCTYCKVTFGCILGVISRL